MADAVFVASAQSVNGFVTSAAVNVPAGTQDNDVLITVVGYRFATTLTPPGGWTLIAAIDDTTNIKFRVYSRVANAEPASYTWSISGAGNNLILFCAAYRNCSSASNGIDTFSTTDGGSASPQASTSVTSSRDKEIALDCTFWFASGTTLSQPAGWTDRFNDTTVLATGVAEKLITPAGAFSANVSYAGGIRNIGIMVVLNALLAGGAPGLLVSD